MNSVMYYSIKSVVDAQRFSHRHTAFGTTSNDATRLCYYPIKGLIGQFITTLGGYIMPPLMLLIGLSAAYYGHPSLFLSAYIIIFIYF